MLLARRSIALLAAYLVALQVLFLPLGVAAGSVSSGVRCKADQPIQHHTQGCPCPAGCGSGCCVQALIAPPGQVVGVLTLSAPGTLQFAWDRRVRPALQMTQSARAPPAINRI
jgi:hypothetical protein